VIHSYWKPVPGRFKDYIALPKPNMYQSLHTAVIGPYGERVEIQIRTQEMHRVAEEGIAAHWRYKDGKPVEFNDMQRFSWLRQLLEWQQNMQDPQEFLHTIKEDLFSDEVYAFTPKGDLLSFPKGSTVIDFAYRIHSEVGQHCSAARVNGQIVPLKYMLRSGDTVEIITTHQQTPSRDWLKLVKTPRAKSRIRNWIKAQQRERSVALGREILEGDLGHYHLDYAALRREGRIEAIATELGVKDEETLLASVGYGKITPYQVLAKLLPAEKLEGDKKRPQGALERLFRLVSGQKKDLSVKVKGVGDVLVRFARCCHPLPGENIVGFITRGRGVVVHVSSCPKVLESDPHRKVEVSWQDDGQTLRPIKIDVSCVDRPGLLAAISAAITSAKVNIARAQVRTYPDQKALNSFEVMISNSDQLKRVLQNISKVKGVYKATRTAG
jgi:GTP pyrophosphokinase